MDLLKELELRMAAIEARLDRYENMVTPTMQTVAPEGDKPSASNPFVQRRRAQEQEVVFRPKGEFSTPEEVQQAAMQQMENMERVELRE